MILCAIENTNFKTNNTIFSYDDLIEFNNRILYDKMLIDFTNRINKRINIINEIIEIVKEHIIDNKSDFKQYSIKIKKEQMILKSLLILFSNDLDSLRLYYLKSKLLDDIKLYIELIERISEIDILDIVYNFYNKSSNNGNIKLFRLDNNNIRIKYNNRECLTVDYNIIISLDKVSCVYDNIINLIKNNMIIRKNDDNNYKDFILGIFYLVLMGIKFEI